MPRKRTPKKVTRPAGDSGGLAEQSASPGGRREYDAPRRSPGLRDQGPVWLAAHLSDGTIAEGDACITTGPRFPAGPYVADGVSTDVGLAAWCEWFVRDGLLTLIPVDIETGEPLP